MKRKMPSPAKQAKPLAFIGSSGESVIVANKIAAGIEHFVEPTVWDKAFPPGQLTLETLLEKLACSDFGIFVFAPDDVAKIRQRQYAVTRDNVIFELGLFIGRLGRKRCIAVVPRGVDKLHLPTDLAGLTLATFDANRGDGDLRQALVPVCEMIRDVVASYGKYSQVEEEMARYFVAQFGEWFSGRVATPLAGKKLLVEHLAAEALPTPWDALPKSRRTRKNPKS